MSRLTDSQSFSTEANSVVSLGPSIADRRASLLERSQPSNSRGKKRSEAVTINRNITSAPSTIPGLMLPNLITDILVHISSFLTTIDYGSLRRTCKTIEQKLFPFFAVEFFSKWHIFIFPQSIQSLIDISKHTELRIYVKTLVIGMDVIHHRGIQLNAHAQVDDALSTLLKDAAWALDTGFWTEGLQEAFTGLPSLSTIRIQDSEKQLRPRENTPVQGYFIRTLARHFGEDYIESSGCQIQHAIVPHILLLAARGNIRLQSFVATTSSPAFSIELVRSIVPSSEMLRPHFSCLLENVQTLMLGFSVGQFGRIREAQTIPNVGLFFNLVAKLRHLRLDFQDPEPAKYNSDRSIRTPDYIIKALTDSLKASTSLRTLELQNASLSASNLLTLLRIARSSIERLTFHRIHLDSNDGWKRLVTCFAKLPKLSSFHANDCSGKLPMAWNIAKWPDRLHVDSLDDFYERAEKNVFIVHPTTKEYRIRQGDVPHGELSTIISTSLVVQDEGFNQKYGTNSRSGLIFSPHGYNRTDMRFSMPFAISSIPLPTHEFNQIEQLETDLSEGEGID
ncbi:hypothetical protein BT63DRAFT_453694 [Microthyrium microscopicum]|uniref:F-box domain-containing protein n=1 Tax=Microthyrium microscopicum TaxID=703497 RepID=A0A6A6UIK1_9PEZI|nr:hypothetical protein BT63DRAFT_453694 [Microthyrium microscopicum]